MEDTYFASPLKTVLLDGVVRGWGEQLDQLDGELIALVAQGAIGDAIDRVEKKLDAVDRVEKKLSFVRRALLGSASEWPRQIPCERRSLAPPPGVAGRPEVAAAMREQDVSSGKGTSGRRAGTDEANSSHVGGGCRRAGDSRDVDSTLEDDASTIGSRHDLTEGEESNGEENHDDGGSVVSLGVASHSRQSASESSGRSGRSRDGGTRLAASASG